MIAKTVICVWSGLLVGAVVTAQANELTLVERYGVLGLLAIVIIWVLRIGSTQADTMDKIKNVLVELLAQVKRDRESEDAERRRAVSEIREDIKRLHQDVLSTNGRKPQLPA